MAEPLLSFRVKEDLKWAPSLPTILISRPRCFLLQEEEAPKDQDFEAYVSNIKDLAAQIIQLSPNIPTEASIILKNIENPSFLIHFISSNLNSELTEKQELLANRSYQIAGGPADAIVATGTSIC